jgi:hypothetical protein
VLPPDQQKEEPWKNEALRVDPGWMQIVSNKVPFLDDSDHEENFLSTK